MVGGSVGISNSLETYCRRKQSYMQKMYEFMNLVTRGFIADHYYAPADWNHL